MAKTISNLLVGIGFDLDKKSTGKVSSGIDNIKSKALKLGGIVAGAFGIKNLTSDFASAKDDLGKFAKVMGVSADDVHAFGGALRLEGGTLSGFMGQLESFQKFRAGFLTGDIGFLPAAAKAGVDTDAIRDAKDAIEAWLSVADLMQKSTGEERLNIASSLGLDRAAVLLLSRGKKALLEIVEQQRKIRPVTLGMTEMAAEFNNSTQTLLENMGSVADKFSKILLPGIIESLNELNGWFEKFRDLSPSGLASEVVKSIASRPRDLVQKPKFVRATKARSVAEKAEADLLEREVLAEFFKKSGMSQSDIDRGAQKQPIIVKANFTLDGKIIDSKVIKVVGEMADQAIQDLSSTEGG